ncbi:MAG: NAD(P)-dependent glycerol-3-phosphate dehydrogenase [Chloroflexi bacterium]|nr:NAD(P)-dependent glycerol-3-phosphate dehydrogenase [Chloroflexota bacterium]
MVGGGWDGLDTPNPKSKIQNPKSRIAVVNAGGWGTALAVVLASQGHEVRLWARRPELAESINLRRENSDYLPGVAIPPPIRATADLEAVVDDSSVVVVATISRAMRQIARQLAPLLAPSMLVVHGTKGLEQDSLLRMSQVLEQELGPSFHGKVAALSGPTHAEEVGRGIPTAAVIACPDQERARALQRVFNCLSFRIYTNPDHVVVELCGAVKNVVALATGISDGLGFSDNARAALITRSLAEIGRLVCAEEGAIATVFGLAGIGDIVATCTSHHSRNRWAGEQLGRGRKLEDVLASTRMVVEGVPATRATLVLAERRGVEMPIAQQVYAVLYGGRTPRDALMQLMGRETTGE